ncbi:hypothetical protein ACWDYH_23790 [Nocardia goodfellowii]|uniref:Uncharacterized protein n=1 Tax=Nocardia goodfellowii TaxID=882446 RepID=A0ABS4QJU9_9NOCA|nr:hypothetical protein [Nocardia goodfellowii]MBP2190946.1 hypothetical protein [Nocardia goodfellowii]
MSQISPEDDSGRTFTVNEDWLAAIAGLLLIALVLTGVIPAWLVSPDWLVR